MQETVQFPNPRGETLEATLRVPADLERPPVVVFVHGWGSDRSTGEAERLADGLERAGIAVLSLDLSGHGDSGGDPALSTLEDHQADLRSAMDWVRARGTLGSIGVFGEGSGAAVAIAVASDDARITALVLHAPTAHARRDLAARVDAPTLLLEDEVDSLFDRHRVLADSFHGEHRFIIIPLESKQIGVPTPLTILVERTARWFAGWLGAEVRATGGMKSVFEPAASPEAPPPYVDRADAGRRLAERLGPHAGVQTLVLALPRGGVAVAEPIAEVLGADLDVLVVRKIRVPFQPELGLGAVAEDGVVEWNEPLLKELGYGEEVRRRELERAHRQLADHVAIYRAAAPRCPIEDRTVILVDDGIGTGGTVRAAVAAIQRGKPKHLVVALPGGAPDVLERIAALSGVDELLAPERPKSFAAVGELYVSYGPTSTDTVCDALRRAHERRRTMMAG